MTAQTCPHCFAPVRGDGRPTCLCAAADAEDFDPLRVRPYVSLPGQDGADEEWNAPLGRSGESPDARPDTRTGGPSLLPHALSTVPRPRRSGPTSRTFLSSEAEPVTDAASGGPVSPGAPTGRAAPRKRGLPAVLAVAGAAVAATAVLIGSDALSGGERDRAAPPDRGTAAPTAAFPTRGPRSSETGTPSAPPPHRSPSRHPGSRTAPRKTVAPYRTAAPRPPAPTRASGSVGHTPGGRPSSAPTGPIVLREGSSGPEVAELQDRLRQLGRYPGLNDGRYDADVRNAVSSYQQAYGVSGDQDGVYGEQTRVSLESRTDEP
ncbi:peptidoglycan-binding protein [Streptomyces sp. NPDC101150]|uniref:peptidoglycan-binding domain-containing protein n=1 Tax=Streptomyces sp. NPDC101150 TaxID=3366114 RepID=UPI0037F76591